MTGLGSPQQWFTVLERYHPTTCTISDLIVGNAYSFRVFSENQCGLSTSAATTKELARIQKAGGSGPGTKTKSGLPDAPPLPAPGWARPVRGHQHPSWWASRGCSSPECPLPSAPRLRSNAHAHPFPRGTVQKWMWWTDLNKHIRANPWEGDASPGRLRVYSKVAGGCRHHRGHRGSRMVSQGNYSGGQDAWGGRVCELAQTQAF